MSQELTNVHNYYGMTFQNCSMPNATFQTINQASPASEPAASAPAKGSEQDIKEALRKLLEATDEEGKKIFTEKAQWYAVYRVLSEHCGYPKTMSDFSRIMTNMGMKEVTPAFSYDSMKRVPQDVSNVQQKLALWEMYSPIAASKFKKQIDVATTLMRLLDI